MASFVDSLNAFQSAAGSSVVAGLPTTIIVLVAALVIAIWAHRRQSSSWDNPSRKDELEDSKLTSTTTSNGEALSESPPLAQPSRIIDATKDVWADRRLKGIAAASSHGAKSEAPDEKPFGSKYYYAHNNSGATGGYSDGLKMEDFTMNGPRLLSRSGTPLQVVQPNSAQEPAAEISALNPPSGDDIKLKPRTPEKRTLLIARYLWDDPGDSSGIANIRIEQLPGVPSTETVSWKDTEVSEASAEITGDGGLLVLVRTTSAFHYKLHIPRLYGEVTSIKTIIKPQKRLIVRLYKKKGFLNVKAWPHPQKKA